MPGTMGVWAEPFTKTPPDQALQPHAGPFERADITSNTYWDWIMNHVPQVYEAMEEVSSSWRSFKEFPPRSVPPSFNPANIMEETLRESKRSRSSSVRSRCYRDEPAGEKKEKAKEGNN